MRRSYSLMSFLGLSLVFSIACASQALDQDMYWLDGLRTSVSVNVSSLSSSNSTDSSNVGNSNSSAVVVGICGRANGEERREKPSRHLFWPILLISLISIPLPGPYTYVWGIAFILYIFEIALALSFDREDKVLNIWLIILMYFTYCQLWIYVILRAFYIDKFQKNKQFWDKTVRFEVQPKK